jgi:acyl-CoA thioesterase FadM
LTVTSLSRSRIAFEFEFLREPDNGVLARGAQAVIWTNPQRHPSLMPDKLFDATAGYFGLHEP